MRQIKMGPQLLWWLQEMVIQNQIVIGFLSVIRFFLAPGNEEIIELLLESNATNVNAVDRDGHTALDAVTIATEGKLKKTAFIA